MATTEFKTKVKTIENEVLLDAYRDMQKQVALGNMDLEFLDTIQELREEIIRRMK